MRWFLVDVLGLFSANVGSFSRNVVPNIRIFSMNPVSKPPMFSVQAVYVIGPLHLACASISIRTAAVHVNVLVWRLMIASLLLDLV